MFRQEYPDNPDEAFMSSGSKFFSTEGIGHLRKNIMKAPVITGNISMEGEVV